jgi:hypothetical protein
MNWAEEYAETKETKSEWRQFNGRQRAQERAKRKALQERDLLYRQWREWHEKTLKEFLGGPHAAAATEIHTFLKNADLNSADQLIELVKQGPWQQADEDTRFQVLRMIDYSVCFLRESSGLEPIDDPLPDQAPSAFIIIRELLKHT